jgi:hypothetical protein
VNYRVPTFWLTVALVVLAWCAPAQAEKRVALVVGNSSYRHISRLENPANDAKLIAETLSALGFNLVGGGPQIDLDKSHLDAVVQSFGNEVQGADVALFYYSGHGVQVNGSNYLVPVGANPIREADVDFQMLDVALVLRQMEDSRARLKIVILDACRNNPFGGRGLRAVGRGLAQIQAPEGTLISYATQPGNVALDGSDGNSPYTNALARTMHRPGLDVFQTFNEVGLTVKRATGGRQQPWVSSSPIDGNFYFVPPEAAFSSAAAPVIERRELARLLQLELRRVGCFGGIADGEFNDSTRAALSRAIKGSGTDLSSDDLSLDALNAMSRIDKRICPLVCPTGERADGERCVRIVCPAGQVSKDGRCIAERAATDSKTRPPAPPKGEKSAKCFTFQGRQFCE